MGEIASRAALLAMLCMCVQSVVRGDYVHLKTCSKESCEYKYSADQISSMSGSQSTLHIGSTVEVSCESIGTYNEQAATKYCLTLKDTTLRAEEETESFTEASEAADKLMSGPFCFVQAKDGKVVSVQYNPEEKLQIVNYKKGIAAAFQANFKKTSVEIEEDTQSRHYSHYSYKTVAPDHVIMHRRVDSESVIQFASSELNGKPISVERAEDVEYKGRKLLRSLGTMVVNVNGPVQSQDISSYQGNGEEAVDSSSPNTFDATFGSGGLTGTGTYSLELQGCMKQLHSTKLRRSVQQSYGLIEGTLSPQYDAEERDYIEMGKLRERFPSLRQALTILYQNFNDTTTKDMVKKLLVLESEHGPLPGYQPAVSEVVDYLNALSSTKEQDLEMRALLYSFLAVEGSLRSQEILLHAISTVTSTKERNTLTVQLAFVRNIHPKVLTQIEYLISTSNDSTDPLVLSYGALASSSPPEIQHRVVQFLMERMDAKKGDNSMLVHFVHSLGNTESNLADKPLLQLVTHDNPSVKMAVAYALRYSVESKEVQSALASALLQNQDPDFAEMVVRALIAGGQSQQLSKIEPIDDTLFQAVVIHTKNNTVLRAMVTYYVKLLGPKAPRKYMDVLSAVHKRDTTWNEQNSVYDLVDDLNTRSSDLTNYPSNRAYIWGKSLGVTDVKLDIAFGAFAGFGGSANPNYFKLFAKGIAQGYAFGYTKTAFEALISSVNAPGATSIKNRLYVSIVGKVLVDYSKEIPTCKFWSYPLYSSPDYTLLSFSTKVFIYVGFLDFTLSLNAKLGVVATLAACINKCVTAKGSIVPTVTVTAAASATASLVEIVRGGVEIAGRFEYNANPTLTGSYMLLRGPFEFCFTITHGWPNNGISIYTFYQLRKVSWCSGWLGISYPCGFDWGDKNKWDALSKDWSLPGFGPNTLWSSCDPSKLQCCPAIAH